MSRKLITVRHETLQNAPYIQRLMCGSNGKCLLTFDQLTQRAHNGGMLIGDKNAAGTSPFIILVGGGSIVRTISGTAPSLDYYNEDTQKYVFSDCGYYGIVLFISYGVPFRLSKTT